MDRNIWLQHTESLWNRWMQENWYAITWTWSNQCFCPQHLTLECLCKPSSYTKVNHKLCPISSTQVTFRQPFFDFTPHTLAPHMQISATQNATLATLHPHPNRFQPHLWCSQTSATPTSTHNFSHTYKRCTRVTSWTSTPIICNNGKFLHVHICYCNSSIFNCNEYRD